MIAFQSVRIFGHYAVAAVAVVPTITGIGRDQEHTPSIRLYGAIPNPFYPTTTVVYSIPKPNLVNLRVYDVQGHLVATLVNERKTGGEHTVTWDRRTLIGIGAASGVYFVRLESGGAVRTRKIVLLR